MKVKIDKATYQYYEEYRLSSLGVEVDIPEELYKKICKAINDFYEAQAVLQKLYKEANDVSKRLS